MMPFLRIGIDDTDSVSGMCTTYVGAVLEKRLLDMGLERLEPCHLVRLNPNCPFKTRGNAAVSLHFKASDVMVEEAVDMAVKTVEELYEKGFEETQPGVVVFRGEDVPSEWRLFALRAVREMVELDEAVKLAERHGAQVFMFNGGRGVIGALAAIACPLTNPTYEAIAYRVRKNWGTVRRIDKQSVIRLHESGLSFDSYNPETGEVRITPHTPCPVLAGVRSLTAENALKGLSMVRFLEEVEMVTVFATNQATDMHLAEKRLAEVKPFDNVIVTGHVASMPETTVGGHVFFRLSDGVGEITCAAYRPTGRLRHIVSLLRPGDIVKVMGGVKPKPQGNTLNIEKLQVIQLARHQIVRPPRCPSCGKRMDSAGFGKGFRCKSCRLRSNKPEITVEERVLRPGFYEVSVSARRHLSRPLCIQYVSPTTNSQ